MSSILSQPCFEALKLVQASASASAAAAGGSGHHGHVPVGRRKESSFPRKRSIMYGVQRYMHTRYNYYTGSTSTWYDYYLIISLLAVTSDRIRIEFLSVRTLVGQGRCSAMIGSVIYVTGCALIHTGIHITVDDHHIFQSFKWFRGG